MSKPQLFLINTDDTVVEILPSEYGKLEFRCPAFNFIKKKINIHEDEHFLVEHVTVLYQDKPCHMFVDEEGHIRSDHKLKPNPKATRLYWNNSYKRLAMYPAIYHDIFNPAVLTQNGCMRLEHWIAGPAVLWTGDME
jgi:hypothetical protein